MGIAAIPLTAMKAAVAYLSMCGICPFWSDLSKRTNLPRAHPASDGAALPANERIRPLPEIAQAAVTNPQMY
ncbi:hypothetical protein Sj15T_25580 [Sphingobium sp. TA15]|nr:hypothetical protein Sj15T_25580 [Sphingobium sp. TA15]